MATDGILTTVLGVLAYVALAWLQYRDLSAKVVRDYGAARLQDPAVKRALILRVAIWIVPHLRQRKWNKALQELRRAAEREDGKW